MSGSNAGHVLWLDLTVENAESVREFYAAVIGWDATEVSMGEYSDYMMMASGDRPARAPEQAQVVAGICHAKGENSGLPAQWVNYFGVVDLGQSLEKVSELGGKQVGEIRTYGPSRFAVIEDPAGAVCGLFENVSH